MEGNNKLFFGILAITISIVFVATLVPIITESSDSIISKANNDTTGCYTYRQSINPSLTVSLGSSEILIGDYSIVPTEQTILVACDEWAVFAFNTSDIYVLEDGGFDKVKSGTSLTISNYKLNYTTIEDEEVEKAVIGRVLYATDKNPTYYRAPLAANSFNINADAQLYIFNNRLLNNAELTPSSIGPFIMYFKGTYDDTQKVVNSLGIDATMKLTTDPTESAGHLVVTNQFDITGTNDTGTYSITGTMPVYAPISYDTITSSDSASRTIIEVIPVLLIIAVLIMAASLVILKKE